MSATEYTAVKTWDELLSAIENDPPVQWVAQPDLPVPAALERMYRRDRRIEARQRPRKPTHQHIAWAYSGHSAERIAQLWEVPLKAVRAGLALVQRYEEWQGFRIFAGPPPKLEPLFGCRPHVPNGECSHDDRHFTVENPFDCMDCGRSFYDEHPFFWPSIEDPAPIAKLPDPPPENLTRKQRRERKHPKILLAVAQEVAPTDGEKNEVFSEACPTV